MSGETTKLVPKLRFPEFQGAEGWGADGLGTLADFANEKISLEEVALEDYVSTENILADYGGIARASKLPTTDSVTRFKSNDMLVSNIRPYLKKVWRADKDGGASNDVIVIRAKPKLLPQYLSALLKNDAFIDYVMTGAKGVKMPRGDIASMKAYPAPYPSKPEQQKIADCLSSLDELIAAQARKVDALKTHKKGLMQQLFPREGETQPRLRFPEFRTAGEWEVLPIGEKVELLSGYPFDGPDISPDTTGVPLLRGINVTEGRVRHNAEIDRYFTGSVEALEKYKLQLNDLVIGMDGSKVGKNSALIATADTGALLIQRVARLRTKSVDLIRFISQQINSSKFHRYVDKINTSSGIPHISATQIKEFCIAFPSTQEQQRIADCLTSLEALITAATQELAILKTHKKGLMQQLFPSAEAVDA
nr:restriction endonuclease subunit S [Rhodoferax sp.]